MEEDISTVRSSNVSVGKRKEFFIFFLVIYYYAYYTCINDTCCYLIIIINDNYGLDGSNNNITVGSRKVSICCRVTVCELSYKIYATNYN